MRLFRRNFGEEREEMNQIVSEEPRFFVGEFLRVVFCIKSFELLNILISELHIFEE